MGLMRVARRAGSQVASRVAAVRTTKALANAGGSNAPTSNKIPLSIFPVAAASSRPRASPVEKHDGALAHDQSQHHPGLCPKRHADSDLARAPRDRIRFDSIETNDSQTERQSPKDREHGRAGAHKPKVQVRIEKLGKCLQRNDWE